VTYCNVLHIYGLTRSDLQADSIRPENAQLGSAGVEILAQSWELRATDKSEAARKRNATNQSLRMQVSFFLIYQMSNFRTAGRTVFSKGYCLMHNHCHCHCHPQLVTVSCSIFIATFFDPPFLIFC